MTIQQQLIRQRWITRGLVLLVFVCALMWGLTADMLKHEQRTVKQLQTAQQQCESVR